MRQTNEQFIKYATREKNPTNDDNMIYYSETFADEYEITADEERILSFPDIPVGAAMIQVNLGIDTLSDRSWRWDPTTRVLTLKGGPVISPWDYPSADDVNTSAGQLVSVLYKIIKTTI